MFGAIVGDIVGSVYEWNNIKTKSFALFREDCFFTDDSIMTIAVAEALMNGGQEDVWIDAMKRYGRMYPQADYGARFGAWLAGDSRAPYHSWGNGAPMRVSPVGYYALLTQEEADAAREVAYYAQQSAQVTHDHPEGIKGAQAVADAILFLRYARQDAREVERRKVALRARITAQFGYDLSRTLDEIRPDYRFDESSQRTVPQAITAFLESTDFEDAIRNAISLGGDSDTLAAITGSIAEAAYGIPEWIREKAWSYLDDTLQDACRRWDAFLIERMQAHGAAV